MQSVVQVAVMALVVYMVALWILRSGKKRLLGHNSVFDSVLAFILGSTLARAINGGAPLLSTAVAGFILVGMHALFGIIARRSSSFGLIVKGGATPLIVDGEPDEAAMARHHITRHDLEEAARQHGMADLETVKHATFERNGSISMVRRPTTRVVDIDVEEGVQRLRIIVDA